MNDNDNINSANTVNIYVRIAAELDERFRVAVARQRMSKPKAVEAAIEEWVRLVEGHKPSLRIEPHSQPRPAQSGAPTHGVPRSEWHRMLDQVLDTSVTNPLVISIITNLLAYGYDAAAISKGNYKRYEVETRVLRELTAELLGTEQAEEISDIARFMEECTTDDREAVRLMIKAWKHSQSQNHGPKDAPKKEPRKTPDTKRKAV